MDRTLQLLLLSADEGSLRSEVEVALQDLPEELRVALHAEVDLHRGVEHALDRGPDLVLLELGDDVGRVERVLQEIGRGAEGIPVVVVYRPEILEADNRSTTVLIDLMRSGARDFLRRPIATSELMPLLRRHLDGAAGVTTTRGKVVCFLGNKGGVGKSSASLSVACDLAEVAPERVLLIDGSLQHGAMCELLGLVPEATLADAARQIDRLDERLLRMLSTYHSSGLRVLAAPANAIDSAGVDEYAIARILSVARHAFDYVVVDTFPLIDAVTVAILDLADLAFVVTSDFVPSVLGTVELLKVLDRIGVSNDRLRITLNHISPLFRGRLRPADVAERLQRDLDFVLPYSRGVMASANTGDPYIMKAPIWSRYRRSIHGLRREIVAQSGRQRVDGLKVRVPGEAAAEGASAGIASEGLAKVQKA